MAEEQQISCYPNMKNLIASHIHSIYLKPGEVLATRSPMLVSTVLGSCVAVTMFSPSRGFGAICHAMLPANSDQEEDLRYVDTAVKHLYAKAIEQGAGADLVVKLFGGAHVLGVKDNKLAKLTIGEQNVVQAEAVLGSLGLAASARNTGGYRGRKLFFCTRSGDVYMRRMRAGKPALNKDTTN
ncbi:MAG: chemotaxis protein CheD [Proteobacteria bacterium]|nr:chemotaxis protein CheD [Pseudomonadota bacterium]